MFLLKVKLPPIEKSKTRPNLPYPTLPYPVHLTKPYPPYPYSHIPQHHPYPHLQQEHQRHYINTCLTPTEIGPYTQIHQRYQQPLAQPLPSSSSTPSTPILSYPLLKFGRNDSGPKQPRAETTHPKNWPKRPRPKRPGFISLVKVVLVNDCHSDVSPVNISDSVDFLSCPSFVCKPQVIDP